MRSSTRLIGAVFGLLMATSFGAVADDTDGPTLSEIRTQQTELRKEVAKGADIFQAMSEAERKSLTARQDELLAMIEGKEIVRELDDEEQVRAFNLLQEINAMVNDVEDDRVVCEYVRKTGSHRKTKDCATVAERRVRREAAQNNLRETLNRFCANAACG